MNCGQNQGVWRLRFRRTYVLLYDCYEVFGKRFPLSQCSRFALPFSFPGHCQGHAGHGRSLLFPKPSCYPFLRKLFRKFLQLFFARITYLRFLPFQRIIPAVTGKRTNQRREECRGALQFRFHGNIHRVLSARHLIRNHRLHQSQDLLDTRLPFLHFSLIRKFSPIALFWRLLQARLRGRQSYSSRRRPSRARLYTRFCRRF